jgi:hypothetical protein
VKATKLRANLTKSTEVGKTNEQCLKNGETFKEGELYRHNHLRYKCTSGVMHVLGKHIVKSIKNEDRKSVSSNNYLSRIELENLTAPVLEFSKRT